MENTKNIIRLALKEDHAWHDVTSRATMPGNKFITADLIVKNNGVICGLDIVKEVFKMLDTKSCTKAYVRDGAKVSKGKVVARVAGPAKAILAGERTALNFLQHLSGIATYTRKFVDETRGTRAKIYDTRKTFPGLRALEKYAVVCGGGYNHRMNLSELALVKDNHISALRDIGAAVAKIRKYRPSIKIEVECDNLPQVGEALAAGADIIMLDNMSVAEVKKAVKKVKEFNKLSGRKTPELEISGGITLSTVKEYAKTGCNRISVGALTHSAPALDISMEIHNT
jgi:nicotinate-nucleotide pyrophosphorylase (carboxylating)